jgi:hypothetical protein
MACPTLFWLADAPYIAILLALKKAPIDSVDPEDTFGTPLLSLMNAKSGY